MKTRIGSLAWAVLMISGGVVAGCTVTTEGPPPPMYPPRAYRPPPPRYGYQPPPSYAQAPPAGYQPPPAAYPAPPARAYAPPPSAQAPCIDPGAQDIPDIFDSPAKLAANSTTVGCTARGDADLFSVSVPPGRGTQLVRFSLRGQGDMVPLIRVFDANRKRIDQLSADKHQELRGWAAVAPGTSFFLWVSQTYNANDVYTLTTTTTPLADVGEPNDDADHATPLYAGRPISAFLAGVLNDPASLADWYRVELHGDDDLTVDIDMSQGVSSQIKLFNSNRHEVTSQSAGAGERYQFKARVKGGVYHLKLTCIYGLAAAGQGDPPIRLTRPYVIALAR